MKNYGVERKLSDAYNLENDDRLTLPDDSIFVFNHDMINGHLNGFKIQGGNFIKISRIPAKTKVYWNSKFHRGSAKLLDESNRGVRILKQNNLKIMMTFQNFYIWTEGNIDDVENWSENQRMLQIEVSGVGAEITPLVANPSSDIYVDKVESVGDINHILNFGKKGTIVEAGNWAKNMQEYANKTNQQTLQIAENTEHSNVNEQEIIDNLESLNTTATNSYNELMDINTELDGQSTKIDTANASLTTANASLTTANTLLTEIKTEQSAQGIQLETSNANTLASATALNAIKDKQAEDSLTLTNISANAMSIKTNTQGIAKETTLSDLKNANHTDLTDLKNANHTDLTALATKLEAGLSLLDSKLALMNLEATQQDIVSKINTIKLQLNTLNTLLSNTNIGNGLVVPNDFVFNVTSSNNKYGLIASSNHKRHQHLLFQAIPENWVESDFHRRTIRLKIQSNYQVRFNVKHSIGYSFLDVPNVAPLSNTEKQEIQDFYQKARVYIELGAIATTGYEESFSTIAENYKTRQAVKATNLYDSERWALLVQTFWEYETTNKANSYFEILLITNICNAQIPVTSLGNKVYRLTPNITNLYIEFDNIFEKALD